MIMPILQFGGNAGSEIKLAMVGACGPRWKDSNNYTLECREGVDMIRALVSYHLPATSVVGVLHLVSHATWTT